MNYKQPSENDIKDFCKIVETEAEHLPSNGSRFYEVESFEALVKLVAHLRFTNRDYLLLFRGQEELYKNQDDYYSFYPSIFRGSEKRSRFMPNEFNSNKERLEKAKNLLQEQQEIKRHMDTWDERGKEQKKKSLLYSIIQHYELAKTPLLDLTHSLQVACSFGYKNKNNTYCFIAVFGLPHLEGTHILYKKKPSIINIPLLHNCPPDILRPHFQEAYSIGLNFFPLQKLKKKGHDLKKYLTAIIKVKLDDSNKKKYCLDKDYLQLKQDKIPSYIAHVNNLIKQANVLE